MVLNGELIDNKSTSVVTYMMNRNDLNYQLQGSIYKWLNPDKITSDTITINYIFTDWSRLQSNLKSDYPQSRLLEKKIPLLSLKETEEFISNKLNQIKTYLDEPEELIPECNDEELWKDNTIYKYYKNPSNMTRSTKNFTKLNEALAHQSIQGVGIVVPVEGKVKRCKYCPCASICQQRLRYNIE